MIKFIKKLNNSKILISIYSSLFFLFYGLLNQPLKAQSTRENNLKNNPSNFIKQQAKVGKFNFQGYEPPKLPELEETVRVIKQQKFIEAYINFLNRQRFNLPDDLPISWQNCLVEDQNGKISSNINAFYSFPPSQVSLCYGLYQFLFEQFSKTQSKKEAYQSAAEAYSFIFLHEIGHALVHVLEIPVTGKEEDAVDDFAAYILDAVDNIDEILNGARGFIYISEELQRDSKTGEIPPQLIYWDEHSLGEQRYGNLVCFIMGKQVWMNLNSINPSEKEVRKVFEELVEQLGAKWQIHPRRARKCPGEYEQKQKNWVKLIVPHLIPAAPSNGNCRWGNC